LASCKEVGRCIKKSYLKTLVEKKKQKYKVSSEISHSTIRSRSWRGIAKSNGPGAKSPLADAEKALVEICIQMGKIRQPLNCTEAIELLNNLIEDTDSQIELVKFQMQWKLGCKDGKVSNGLLKGFLHRHEHELVTKHGERCARNHHDWTTLANIKQMYNVIYNEMVDVNIAIELVTHTFTDIYGNTADEDNHFGLKQNIQIFHPFYIMFVDESGFSISQKKDGSTDCCKHGRSQVHPPPIHFCNWQGCLLCHKQAGVPATWATGIDHSVPPV